MIERDGSSTPIPEAPVTDQPTTPNRDDETPPRVTPVGRPQPKREDDGVQPVTGL